MQSTIGRSRDRGNPLASGLHTIDCILSVAAAVSPEHYCNYVEGAACFIAERHRFTPGREQKVRGAAEEKIDRMIAETMIQIE